MPTVPTYQRQVGPQPVQSRGLTANVTAQQMGGGVGQGLQNLSGAIFKVAEDERKKANQVALLEADTQLGQFETNRLYDPESGAMTTRGKDAFDLPETVINEYDQLVGEIGKNLSNDEQRAAFARIAANRRQQINTSIQRHVAGEMEAYDDQQTQSSLSMSRSTAISNYNDPQRVQLEIARQAAVISDYADRHGLPAEYVQERSEKAASATYVGVLDRMVADDPLAAREYYSTVKDSLIGEDQAQAEAVIAEKAMAYEADDMAASIASAGGEKLSDWMTEANAIEDPRMRREVKANLQDRWQVVEVERDELTRDAYRVVEEGGRPADIPVSQWLKLSPSARQGIESRYRQVQRGIQPVQSDRAWLEFSDLPVKELAEMGQGELYDQYRNNLDDAHWNSAVAQWQDAQAAVEGGASEDVTRRLSSTLTFKDRTKNAAIEAGIIPSDKPASQYNDTHVRRFARFEEAAARRIENEELAKGGKLTGNETQAVLDDMVMQTVFIERMLRPDPEVPVDALLEDETGRAYVPIEDIPDAAVARTISYAQSNGYRLPSSEKDRNDRIQRAYAAALRGDDQMVDAILRGE